MNKDEISEELLNSYLDNELGSEERDELLNALEGDAELSRRMCELRNVKELTQHAYRMDYGDSRNRSHWLTDKAPLTAVATIMLMVTGALAGWFAHSELDQPTSLSQLDSTSQLASLDSMQVTDQKKIILHVDTDEPERFNTALDSVENLLVAYAKQNRSLELEIIANAKGLNLFRTGTTTNPVRIQELAKKYDNLSILACNKAIKQLEEMGVKVQLIPEAGIAPSALENIVHRLQQGWVYIKI